MFDLNEISDMLFENLKKVFFPEEWLRLDMKFSKSEIFASTGLILVLGILVLTTGFPVIGGVLGIEIVSENNPCIRLSVSTIVDLGILSNSEFCVG